MPSHADAIRIYSSHLLALYFPYKKRFRCSSSSHPSVCLNRSVFFLCFAVTEAIFTVRRVSPSVFGFLFLLMFLCVYSNYNFFCPIFCCCCCIDAQSPFVPFNCSFVGGHVGCVSQTQSNHRPTPPQTSNAVLYVL